MHTNTEQTQFFSRTGNAQFDGYSQMDVRNESFRAGLVPFAPVALGAASGIALQHLLQLPAMLLWGSAAALFIALLALRRNVRYATLWLPLLGLLFALLGGVRYAAWQQSTTPAFIRYLPVELDAAEGRVLDIREGASPRLVLALQQIACNGTSRPQTGNVLAYLPAPIEGLRPGHRVAVHNITLDSLPAPRNPGRFDYGGYLRSRGICATFRLRDSADLQIVAGAPFYDVAFHWLYPLRQRLCNALDRHFPPQIAGMLKALLLGVRDDLDRDIREDFQNAGVIHVLAISGLHVGFVALFLHLLFTPLPLYFKWRYGLTILCLIGYMLLTGSNPPVVRATLMAVIFLAGFILERRGNVYNYLFAAAAVILLFQPQQLFWVGFQFSFVAVAAILYFLPRLNHICRPFLDRIDNSRSRELLSKYLVTPFNVSLAAQIGVMPLTMFYFHKLSLISFVINPPIILATALTVAGGLFFLLLQFFGTFLTHALAALLTHYLSAMIWVVHQAANVRGAYLDITRFSLWDVSAYCLAVFWLFHFKNLRLRPFFAATLFSAVGLGLAASVSSPALEMLVLDVGQGDAILLKTPAQKALLIDAGPAGETWSSGETAVLPGTRALQITSLRGLFITHPHWDHYGGTFALIGKIPIDTVYLPPIPLPLPFDSLMSALDSADIPVRHLRAGEVIGIDPQTKLYVLSPDSALASYSDDDGSSINNSSLVMLLKHRQTGILLTGDAEATAEAQLRRWQYFLRCDILKVGHHGSATSSTPALLSYSKPKIACISVGRFNRFGHPDPLILRRLNAIGATVYRTDRQQAVWLRYQNQSWHRIIWK